MSTRCRRTRITRAGAASNPVPVRGVALAIAPTATAATRAHANEGTSVVSIMLCEFSGHANDEPDVFMVVSYVYCHIEMSTLSPRTRTTRVDAASNPVPARGVALAIVPTATAATRAHVNEGRSAPLAPLVEAAAPSRRSQRCSRRGVGGRRRLHRNRRIRSLRVRSGRRPNH